MSEVPQTTSARAAILGIIMYSTCSGVFIYSVHTLPCAPKIYFASSGVNTAGVGSNEQHTRALQSVKDLLDTDTPGFISAHWDGTTETELEIKEQTKATIRCIPLDGEAEEGTCILTGKPSARRVLFAKAY